MHGVMGKIRKETWKRRPKGPEWWNGYIFILVLPLQVLAWHPSGDLGMQGWIWVPS